ncbi:MAG: mitofilin family membrane protein, partial [Rickettsia endosymbiont of Ixodes persulcatus]|nr:mitofilin family membrane protein [Rickettsia endosymbiont of Ixodes persulcatus]
LYQTYVTPNEPAVKVEPIEPGSPVGHIKKRKRWGLRIVLTSVLLTTLFYGGSVYFSQYSERYRDFFIEEMPLGESLVQLLEDRKTDKDLVKRLSEKAAQASGKQQELTKQRAERMAAFAREQAEKAKARAAEAAEKVKDTLQSGKEQVTQAATKIEKGIEENTAHLKQNVEAATEKAKDKAEEVKESVAETVGSAKESVKEAVKVDYPKETLPVDYQRPRPLDASPQPPKVADAQPYTGPPLPLGFEPPPGYTLAKAKPVAEKAAVEAVVVAPEPLPLVAPTVSELSASEPVLGQLASTIDSLTRFLNDSPSIVENKGAREVINVAGIDLQSLGKRLEAVKEEERQKLAERLEEKAREFNQNLMHAEREMVERLEKQEDDWKTAFEHEREELVKAYREKLDGELSVQKEIIEQRLNEEVVAQGVEMQRRWLREIKEKVETERAGRLGKLEALQDGFEKLGKTTLENSSWLDDNRQVNKLWTAIRTSWQASVGGKDNTPFARELAALSNVAKRSPTSASLEEENTIDIVLSTIPDSVQAHGVESFPTLAGWFTDRLVPKIKKAAVFPQNGGFEA